MGEETLFNSFFEARIILIQKPDMHNTKKKKTTDQKLSQIWM